MNPATDAFARREERTVAWNRGSFDHYQSVDEFEQAARRILPRHLFDYVASGSFSEVTLRNNLQAFDRYTLRPEILVDVSDCRLTTSFLGGHHCLPLMLAPTALAGVLWPKGEQEAARAAHAAGIPYCLSTVSVCSIESVRDNSDGGLAFQLYMTRDRGIAERLIARAERAGYSSLFVTVDVPTLAKRERDARNGLGVGGRHRARTIGNILLRPGWLLRTLSGGLPQLGNFADLPGLGRDITVQARTVANLLDPAVTWADVDWLRRRWRGKLVLKGILDPDDAIRAANAGVDALVVSNHGGRQLDGAIAAIDALADVVAAVNDRIEILFDGGIRRGRHVAVALALGARACLVGRAHLYGLAVGGETGVARVLQLISEEFKTTCALMGISDLARFRSSARLRLMQAPYGGPNRCNP
jgi:isopentenyl diphosphate isomerase/L-lactate dehydrogenase-like FMN-dependent dehydrogenase